MNKIAEMMPVLVLVIAVVGIGAFAIAVQPVSNEKIHIQDTTGKIQTNVPVSASRAFSPLPIQWSDQFSGAINPDDGITMGSDIVSKQKMVVNFVGDVSTRGCFWMFVDNLSEDDQIFVLRGGAPSLVMLDISDNACGFLSTAPTDTVEVLGMVGHNEWLMHVENSPIEDSFMIPVIAEVTDGGSYPIVFELERVG